MLIYLIFRKYFQFPQLSSCLNFHISKRFSCFNDYSLVAVAILSFKFTFFLKFCVVDSVQCYSPYWDNIPVTFICHFLKCHIVCRVVSNIESNFTLAIWIPNFHFSAFFFHCNNTRSFYCWSKRLSSCRNWMRMTMKVASVVNIYAWSKWKISKKVIRIANFDRHRSPLNSPWTITENSC